MDFRLLALLLLFLTVFAAGTSYAATLTVTKTADTNDGVCDADCSLREASILCQSETYRGELVRYIHLNPVRARMVAGPEDYPYSSHLSYIGSEPAGIVDVDPVLRLFAARRSVARAEFKKYVQLGISDRSIEELHLAEDGQILGDEEFVDSTIHRIGDTGRAQRPTDGRLRNESAQIDTAALISSVELVCGGQVVLL